MSKKLTTEEWVAKARAVHGDRYDYSKVEYINGKTKVCIICPEHGEFSIIYSNAVDCRTRELRQYCKDNGIKLIEIRYDEDVWEVLNEKLPNNNDK